MGNNLSSNFHPVTSSPTSPLNLFSSSQVQQELGIIILLPVSHQDQRVGEPEDHRPSSRQSAGPTVRHVRSAAGSAAAEQQAGQSAGRELQMDFCF